MQQARYTEQRVGEASLNYSNAAYAHIAFVKSNKTNDMAKLKNKTAEEKKEKPVKQRKKDIAEPAVYDKLKDFKGKKYSGMQIGRSHHWHYDKGDWKETKITPDLWEVSYAVTKRRAGKAPENSGVPVGTAYQWYILAHQKVVKLSANDYSTSLTGLKFKLAHKRADKGKWNIKEATQRKHLIAFLKKFIQQLEEESIPIEFEYNGLKYKGVGLPVAETCEKGICYEADITLNDENLGIIKLAKSGWKMDRIDKGFAKEIGNQIMKYFEPQSL